MVIFPPLAPSSGWFAVFLKNLGEDGDVAEATGKANLALETPKEFGRFSLSSQEGELITLSVPVEGGGRQLRSFRGLDKLQISEHGNWRSWQLKTLEALLGKKPYFPELRSALSDIILDSGLKSLPEFNMAIFQRLYAFLMGNLEPGKLKQFPLNNGRIERGREIAEKINTNVSILQPLAEFGPETLLGVLSNFTNFAF